MSVHRMILASAVLLCCGATGALFVSPIAAAAEPCPNSASRQGPSSSLPDCRVYEQVTPVNKGDSPDLFPILLAANGIVNHETEDRGYATEDEGGKGFLLYTFTANFAHGVSGSNAYVFLRANTGWTTTAIAPTGPGAQNMHGVIFDPVDLSEVGVTDQIGPEFEFPSNDLFASLVGASGGPYVEIDSEPYSPFSAPHPRGVAGASTDLSHVLVESRNHDLTPADAGQDEESNALYESAEGQLRLVNIDSEGKLLSLCGAVLGQGPLFPGRGFAHNAVSGDGSKIFFTSPDPNGRGAGCWEEGAQPEPPQLYMRVDGTSTVDVSAPNPGVSDPNGLQPAVYVGASTDGSKVFFLTRTELTADDKTHGVELYEYDTNSHTLSRISGGAAGAAGNVDFVAAISGDGTKVYFTAFGQLTPGLPTLQAKEVYLYRYDTDTGETTYIARVGSADYPLRESQTGQWYASYFNSGERSAELGSDAQANWYTTADGQYLVFVTKLDITGYDSTKAGGFECGPLDSFVAQIDCAEVYRYDASQPVSSGKPGVADNPVCVSCGPAGVAEVDNSQFARSASKNAPAAGPPRAISEDGSYVFFDTANALVPQARSGVTHVYEWHNGRISLISSADDPGSAFFLGSSKNGSDVFFGTHAQLASSDTDVSGDLYDARIGGGFTGLAPPSCTGTGCQGVPSPPPIFATPSSVTFEGVGNFSARSVSPRLTQTQKLARALRACRRMRNKHRRARCGAHARRQYGRMHKSINARGRA